MPLLPAENSVRIPTVLLVEDEIERRLFSTLLEVHVGCNVVSVTHAAEAAAWLRNNRPDVIHTDIMMPDMSGWELLTALKEDHALAGIPVVVVSAGGIDHPERFSFSGSVHAHLHKPVAAISYVGAMIDAIRSVTTWIPRPKGYVGGARP